MTQSQFIAWRIGLYISIGLLIATLFFVGSAMWMYSYLADLEARNGVLQAHIVFVWAYQLGGKHLAVGLIWLAACIFLAGSVYSFIGALRSRRANFLS